MAITLDVITKVVEGSLKDSASQVERRMSKAGADSGSGFAKEFSKTIGNSGDLQRAFDRVADSAGKLRVEETKLAELRQKGVADGRLIAQAERLEKARRDEARAARDAAKAYDAANTSARGMLGTISDLASGSRFGGMIASTQSLASQFGGMGLAVGGTITAVAGLAAGIGFAATKLYELGSMWDGVADGITARTGKIGADLNGVMDQVKSVALDSTASISDIGNIAGRVSASIGDTGSQLGDLTGYIADLNDMTGEQTNIKQLGMLYRVFGVDASQQIPVLNQLYTAFTNTQTPINELISLAVNAGPKFKQFGMDIGQTVAVLSAFDEAGVNPEAAITGLNKALAQFVKDGKEPKQALEEIIVKIKELHDAGNDQGARSLAEGVFGTKNFAPFLDAIESGKLSVEELRKSLQGIPLDIRDTKAATDDFTEEWKRFKNFLQVDLEPVATTVFSALNQQLEWFTTSMHSTIEGFKTAWGTLKDAIAGTPSTFGTPGAPGLPAVVATGPGAAVAPPAAIGPSATGPVNPLDIIAGKHAAGGIAGRTASGMLYGPGTGTSDSIIGVDGTGMPTARVSTGEGIITAAAMAKPGMPELLATLNRYSTGGVTGGDAALLSNVPPGQYSQTASDLTKGLGDCSSAVEDLVNIMDGMPTGGRSMATGNAAQWLTSRGFLPGYMPGAMNVGFNDHHMQATLPGGTPFNWGSNAAAANRGIGGTGAADPSLTSHFYRPAQNGALPVWLTGADSSGMGGSASAPGGSAGGMGQVGAQLAGDMGISGGLPGMAQWATTFLANMAFAPAIGALSAISSASGSQGGSGLIGMMAARNNIGPGPLGGGVSGTDTVPAMLTPGEYVIPKDQVQHFANGGPVTDMTSLPQDSPSGGGGGFTGLGGLPLAGIQAATAGLDVLAPGAGQAAQVGIQLANRTAAYAGQLAGIGVSGLMETFLPHGSPLADPGKSWVGKLASGFSGARPALPNMAGDKQAGGPQAGQPAPPSDQANPAGTAAPPQTPEQAAALSGQQTTKPNAPMVNIENMHNTTPDGGRKISEQIAYMQMVSHGAGGPR